MSIVVCSLIDDNNILLLKRIKCDYIGYWSFPGGKIEKREHALDAAIRELREESGIDAKVSNYLGLVSEHLIEDGIHKQHFLLHFYELHTENPTIISGNEGRLAWFDLDTIENYKDTIIPSDYLMIDKMVKRKEKNHYSCVIEKLGDKHILRKFE